MAIRDRLAMSEFLPLCPQLRTIFHDVTRLAPSSSGTLAENAFPETFAGTPFTVTVAVTKSTVPVTVEAYKIVVNYNVATNVAINIIL